MNEGNSMSTGNVQQLHTADNDAANEVASRDVSNLVDAVHDALDHVPEVLAARRKYLLAHIGRENPKADSNGDPDDDQEFFRCLSAFYTKMYLELASHQESLRGALTEYYKTRGITSSVAA